MLNKITISDSVGRETVRSATKLLLGAGVLVFVAYLLTLLPGVDRLVPQTPVTFAALVGAVATLVVCGLLVLVAPKLASLTRMSLEGPPTVVENLASVVYWLVLLGAVLVAHAGLAGAVVPLFDGFVWLYDVLFLLAALPAVTVIAIRLYATIDPAATQFADRIAGSEAESSTDEAKSDTDSS